MKANNDDWHMSLNMHVSKIPAESANSALILYHLYVGCKFSKQYSGPQLFLNIRMAIMCLYVQLIHVPVHEEFVSCGMKC